MKDNKLINLKDKTHSYDTKGFSKIRNLIIDMLFEKSVLFFAIRINFPEFWMNLNYFPIDRNVSIEKKLELARQYANRYIYQIIKNINDEFLKIDLAEFSYTVIEKHSKDPNNPNYGFPYLHILFSIRSLIGYNEGILINIKREIYDYSLDCQITYLENKFEIYKFWNYIIKNTKYDKNEFKNHFFYHSDYDSDIYGKFFDFIDFGDQNLTYGDCNSIKHKHSHFQSLNLKIENEYILIHLWNLFFQLSNIFIYKDKLYQKNYNSKYSYTLIGDFTILKEYGKTIMDNLSKHFPFQMEYVNLDNLMIVYFDKAIKSIKNLSYLLPQITINQHLIEFKDGIYNTVYDLFISFNNQKHQLLFNDSELNNNFNCGRYYPFTFPNINKPKYWLNKISQQLNHNQEEVINFCTYFGRLFNSNPLFFDVPKQNNLVLEDPSTSNTGKSKSSLVINLAPTNIDKEIDKEIIDFISKNFILDKFRDRDNIFKLTIGSGSGEHLVIDVKHKDSILYESESDKNVPVLISFNPKYNQEFLNDPAFQARIKLIFFNHIIQNNEIDLEINQKRKYHKILIYCNRLFVSKHIKKKFKLRFLSEKTLPLFKSLFIKIKT